MSNIADPAFASAFPAVDEAKWRVLVDRVLKGAPFEKLVGKTYDGLPIQPLYPRAFDAAPIPTAHVGAWDALARVDQPRAADAHAQALTDLENGATGLQIVLEGATGAYGFGLAPDLDTLDHALESVILETALPIAFDAGAAGTQVAAHLEAIVAARKIAPADVRIFFGLDVLHEDAALCAATALRLRKTGFLAPILVADGRRVHMAGGTEAQELALALAAALAALRALEGAGLSLVDARDAIFFRVAADADQFLTIAKLRALRLLWAQVETACGLAPKPAVIHAETAWRMMTRRDPYVNLLRTTTAAFAAGLGGADQVSVLPFTQALGLPNSFARRLARNTQLVLIEESNLGRVTDAGAGAGGVESLTDEIAHAAWMLFQASEAKGLAAWLPTLSADVASACKARLKNIARRKDALTGTSEFPNIHEKPVAVLEPARALADDALFPPMRLAQGFEALRDRAESMNPRPKIYLATLGAVADFTARAMFAKNFFEAGGIEAVIHVDGDLVAGYRASGASLACLCSSDAVYATQAPDAARALRDAGATLFLAGRPGEMEAALKEAGVSRFVYAGCDLIETLNDALGLLK
ncbi:MAG: mutA [Hyphomicrobiales bacterium]|nr:mutA [Hyphomicrobiales bacterium]